MMEIISARTVALPRAGKSVDLSALGGMQQQKTRAPLRAVTLSDMNSKNATMETKTAAMAVARNAQ
jgi:hypothetical protein